MIAKTQAYAASDGSLHTKLEDAQAVSLAALFTAVEAVPVEPHLQADPNRPAVRFNVDPNAIATRILEKRDVILDILTTTKRSRPGRRLVNGFKQKRAGKAAEASAATAA